MSARTRPLRLSRPALAGTFLLAGTLTLGCAAAGAPRDVPLLARCNVSHDYDTYAIRRVGLMPAMGGKVDPAMTRALEEGLTAEVSRCTPFELVRLSHADLEETRGSEPYRRGAYEPATIIDVARRYRLDAVLFPTVVQQRFYPPIVLGVQADVVASETGLVVWSGSVHLDGTDPAVQEGLEAYFGREEGTVTEAAWDVSLLSPSRYARFAAYQLARLL